MYAIVLDKTKRYLQLNYSNHITVEETKEIISKVQERVKELTGSLKIVYQLSNISVERFCHEYIDFAIFATKTHLDQNVAIVVKDEQSVPVAHLLQKAYWECGVICKIIETKEEALKLFKIEK